MIIHYVGLLNSLFRHYSNYESCIGIKIIINVEYITIILDMYYSILIKYGGLLRVDVMSLAKS